MISKIPKKQKGIFIAALIPLTVFVVTEILSWIIFGGHLFVTQMDYNNFLRSIGITSLSSFALAINMSAGRMDLSLGSQQLVGCLIGGNLAIRMGFGPLGTIVMCMLFAAFAGFFAGLVFVILRLPTFVTGIGMALIYEALSNAFAPEGLMIFGNEKLVLLSNTGFIFGVSLIAIIGVHILLTYSTYGMHHHAIKGGLRVSMNSGLPVNRNILITFLLCGALTGLSGVLDAGYSSYIQPSLNMNSVLITFEGFTPVFLAMFMQKFCPITIGIPFAVIAFRFLSMFLMKFTMPTQAAAAITMIILLILLVLVALLGKKELNAKYKIRSMED